MRPHTVIHMRTIYGYADAGRAYRRWYVHARLIVDKIAILARQPIGRVADVLAITSPRCSVGRNLTRAYQYLTLGSLPDDVVRGTRVALAYYEKTGIIRGPKTEPFAQALRGDDSALVVDTHIARAFGYDPHVARTKYCRNAIGLCIRRVAKRRGWSVTQTQAAIWAGYYRRAYPTGKIPRYDARIIVPF